MKSLIAVFVSILALAGAATQASAAASPETRFNAQWGNSYVKGKLVWYNRSVQVYSELRAASGCRTALYTAYAGTTDTEAEAQSRKTRCDYTDNYNPKLEVDVIGGPNKVYVDLWEGAKLHVRAVCFRGDTECINTYPVNSAALS